MHCHSKLLNNKKIFIAASIKRSEGIPVAEMSVDQPKKKKKKKNPNPLSCKKKKKVKNSNDGNKKAETPINSIRNKSIEKKKRKRIKIPDHVKMALKTNKGE